MEFEVSRLEDVNGDGANLLAKKLAQQIQLALSGDVSGEIATDFGSNVNIVLSIGLKKVKSTHIDDDAVRAEHVKDGETLPVDISGNAETATKATKDSDGNIIKNHYATKDELTQGYVPLSQKGVANGVATLGGDGKVPATQLPSFVDDTLEGYLYNGNFYSDENHTILIAAESGKIYVDLPSNRCYRWSGSQYTEISQSLALGETSSTAYRGDRGKTAYDHSQQTGNPHNTSLNDLGVTATASELNILDGAVVSTSELNNLDGSTGNIQDQLNDKAVPSDIATAIATEVANRNDAITAAIQALDSEKTSTDGTNVQVEVTLENGKVTGVRIVTDNTASSTALQNEANTRSAADQELSTRLTAVGSGKMDKTAKVNSWQATPDNEHVPSEKLVKDSIDAISTGSNQRLDEHELDKDNPHGVSLVQMNVPYLGNCLYDGTTKTLKFLDTRFTSKGTPIATNDPQVGDALYVDGSGNKVFYKGGDLLNGTTIPSGMQPVGVIIKRSGDDVLIHYFNCDVSKKFAAAWIWEITGFVLDGNSHNIVFRQKSSSNADVTIGTFTYSEDNISDFCDALNAWLVEHPGGTTAGAGWNYNWHCEYGYNYQGNLACLVIADNMVDYRQSASIISSGATDSMNMANNLPAVSDSVGYAREGGSHGISAGANAARLIEWYSSNAGTTAVLTRDITPTTAHEIVSKTQFNNDKHCAPLRAAYKTFEEYIKKCVMMKWPCLDYGMKTSYGKAHEWTQALAARQHHNINGDVVNTFPAASYAASINFDSPGLRSGEWRMMGIEDSFEMLSKMTCGLSGHSSYSGYDIVNKTLAAMGGSVVRLTDWRWLAVRSGGNYAWIFSSNGNFNAYYFAYAGRVSAVALLTL